MKSKQHKQSQTTGHDRMTKAGEYSTAGRLIRMVETQFREYPQIEAVLLQGFAVACRSAIDFLDDLETQISDKIVDLKKTPGRRPTGKRSEFTRESASAITQ